jgi:hypothetical protein
MAVADMSVPVVQASRGAMALPRYRHNMLADLNNIVLEPLRRDRIRSPIRVKTRAAP